MLFNIEILGKFPGGGYGNGWSSGGGYGGGYSNGGGSNVKVIKVNIDFANLCTQKRDNNVQW